MPPRPASFPAVTAALLLLAGCASSESTYYTLKPWPGVAQSGGPASLEVRTPSVPSSLDRDYIVRSDHSYKLNIDGNASWSEPLADMIGQTLSADLAQRLPGTAVYTATGAISVTPASTVELDVSQFADDGAGNAVMNGTLSLRANGSAGGIRPEPLHLTVPMHGTGTAALVASLSELVGKAADRAAADARQLALTAPSVPAPLPLTAPPPVPFAAAAAR